MRSVFSPVQSRDLGFFFHLECSNSYCKFLFDSRQLCMLSPRNFFFFSKASSLISLIVFSNFAFFFSAAAWIVWICWLKIASALKNPYWLEWLPRVSCPFQLEVLGFFLLQSRTFLPLSVMLHDLFQVNPVVLLFVVQTGILFCLSSYPFNWKDLP